VGVGTFFARGVTVRIDELAEATHRVGAGDLSVRVKARGADEIADFARAFNRMLAEVEAGRARIEYLQRIGAWQGMARRLAHEIKNPLTPIQLAVQEIHRRYQGQDPEYEKLLDTSLEIVEDEVGTLRRLVTEFSDFARLPRADLADADLREFLERQRERLTLGDDEARDSERDSQLDLAPGVGLGFDLPKDGKPAMVLLDHLMFRRVLINLVRNAMQAIGPAGAGKGEVRVSLRRSGNYWEIDVDDNGPGIDPDLHGAVFDPYVTSKNEGTGLGLAIVKKIVMEHGGTVRALDGPLGGARVEVKLPALGTPPALALLEARKAPDSAPHSDRVLP
jgi:nitrogen fixation/metabolism regulation signal transduction histidine kinase